VGAGHVDDRRHLGGLAHVRFDEDRRSLTAVGPGDGDGRLGLVAPADDDGRAGGEQRAGDGEPDAPGPPVTTATRSVKSNDALSDWAIDTITSPRSEPRSAEAYRGVLAPS